MLWLQAFRLRCAFVAVGTLCAVLLAASPAVADTDVPLPTYATPEIGARSELPAWATDGFADLTVPLSAREASAVTLGPVEHLYLLKPTLAGIEGGIFQATTEQSDSAGVPILLGDRQIGELWFDQTSAGWQPGSVGTESSARNSERESIQQAFVKILGGQPEEVRDVNVFGSSWLFARRGTHEAAGLLATNGYYEFSLGKMPELPSPGMALTGAEFTALARRMRGRSYVADPWLWVLPVFTWIAIGFGALVLGALGWAVWRWLIRPNQQPRPS